MNNDDNGNSAPDTTQPPRSHVTSAPEHIEGESYDPQLRTQYGNEPKVVHATRDIDVAARPISDQNKDLSRKSRQLYPHLNLTDGEFVVLDIKRHPIGLLLPILMTGLVLMVLMAVLIMYPSDQSLGLPSYGVIIAPALLLMLLVGAGGFIAIWVYLQNQFYMTNESVIQEIQQSLFSRHEQTVSLGSIEDASYKQSGVLQTVFNYGTIRLSTEGEETTYRFHYVNDPRKQVAVLNNAIEAFKNGRPVDPYES